MHLELNGTLHPADLNQIIQPLMELLEREGITSLKEISLSFQAWRGDVRIQIVNSHARIVSLTVPAEEMISRAAPTHLVLPDHLKMRDRPVELDNDGFGMFWGRDD